MCIGKQKERELTKNNCSFLCWYQPINKAYYGYKTMNYEHSNPIQKDMYKEDLIACSDCKLIHTPTQTYWSKDLYALSTSLLGTNRIKMASKILAQKNLADESLARILFPQLALKPPTNLSKSYCQTIMLQGCPHLGLDKATKTS